MNFKAINTLCNIIDGIYFTPDHIYGRHMKDYKPGEAYAKLSEDVKEKLKSLTSDDLNKVRLDYIGPIVGYTMWRADVCRRRNER